MAYGATRGDQVGGTARAVGTGAADAANRAVEFSHQHDVAGRARRATTGVVEGVQDVNARYDISGKASTAAQNVTTGAQRLNQQYDITGKTFALGAGVASGVSSLWSRATAPRSQADSQPDPTAPPRSGA